MSYDDMTFFSQKIGWIS